MRFFLFFLFFFFIPLVSYSQENTCEELESAFSSLKSQETSTLKYDLNKLPIGADASASTVSSSCQSAGGVGCYYFAVGSFGCYQYTTYDYSQSPAIATRHVYCACEPGSCDEAAQQCASDCDVESGNNAVHNCVEDAEGNIVDQECNCSPPDDGDCYERRQACVSFCGDQSASFGCTSSSGGVSSNCTCGGDSEASVPNEDSDGDGIPDYKDPDDDNDGVPDVDDPDDDGDGVPDDDGSPGGFGSSGPDSDGDGIPDTSDPDDDNDGIVDSEDSDQDGDGYDDKATDIDPTGKTCDQLQSECIARCDGSGICTENPETGLADSFSCHCADGTQTEEGQTDNKWLEAIADNTRHTATALSSSNSWLETISGQLDSSAQQDKERNQLLENISQNQQIAVNNQSKQLTATQVNGSRLDTIADLLSNGISSTVDFPEASLTTTGTGGDLATNTYSSEFTVAGGFDIVPEDTLSQDISNYIATGIPLVSWLQNSSFNLTSSSPVLSFAFWGKPVHVDFSLYQSVVDIVGDLLFYITIFSSFMLIIKRGKG